MIKISDFEKELIKDLPWAVLNCDDEIVFQTTTYPEAEAAIIVLEEEFPDDFFKSVDLRKEQKKNGK